MRALVCHALSDDFSGVEIREVEPPTPGPGEVLIEVRATSLNFPDLLLCQGKYQLKLDPPFIPGMDLAGTVAALGEGVDSFAIGDAVCGGARFGGFAEYAVVKADGLQHKPDNLSFDEAASYSAAYLTAYVALVRRGRLQAGETLLVHGASGGVGMAAVDVGKLLGATVIATGGSDDKLAKVRAYGADHVLNTRDGFRDQVKGLTDGRGADVIYDPVGGDVFDESVRCIAFDGRLLVIGFTSGRIASVSTNMPLIKGFSVVGVRAGEYGRRFPDRGRENVKQIWAWARDGKTRPCVHDRLPLAQALLGFRDLQNRKIVGKLILNPK
ncbi:MAG: NADPH:quinone oxidoreductase family protein [Hyphomonadaceae bacterium]|nr:NADPH:quinone oxidoreductase family protein [Hyphomonadaceae bacterium]